MAPLMPVGDMVVKLHIIYVANWSVSQSDNFNFEKYTGMHGMGFWVYLRVSFDVAWTRNGTWQCGSQ
jgi:hypothetical protein